MTKKHFISLADTIITHNSNSAKTPFTQDQLDTLADFCRSQNYGFMNGRWFDYINGKTGPSGGKVK